MPDARSERRLSGDAGQTLPLVALILAASVGALLLVAALGPLVVDRARARGAADAVALAGAADGRSAAARVAVANGAVLESYAPDGHGAVEVTVRLGRARASARAVVDDVWVPPSINR